MTAQEMNQKIAEGTKVYGSRNAYLASDEYRKLYAAYKAAAPVKGAKVVEVVEVPHLGNGWFIRTGKNSYAAQLGDGIGCGAGALQFDTKDAAKMYCAKHRLTVQA
jgi:hypothetical protein